MFKSLIILILLYFALINVCFPILYIHTYLGIFLLFLQTFLPELKSNLSETHSIQKINKYCFYVLDLSSESLPSLGHQKYFRRFYIKHFNETSIFFSFWERNREFHQRHMPLTPYAGHAPAKGISFTF